jgi:hypothetical protein
LRGQANECRVCTDNHARFCPEGEGREFRATIPAADKLVDIALIFAKRSNMNSSKINEWLTLTANVAVVGGIVFLAIEISQNNELLRSDSLQKAPTGRLLTTPKLPLS